MKHPSASMMRMSLSTYLSLEPTDVDHHVDLVGTVCHCICGFKNLGGRRAVSVGEADHRADGELITAIFLCLLHVGGGNAYGCGFVFHTVVANRLDLRPGRALSQQGVVNF